MSPSPPTAARPDEDAGALAEVAQAADPMLRAHAVAAPPRGRHEDGFGDDRDRAFVVEAVHQGWLMHYDAPTVFIDMDDDLSLLGGDALYALGLARLAALGDLDGVAELAELISLCARAAAEGRSDLPPQLWAASATALAGEGGGGARAAFARLAPAPSRGGDGG